MRVHTQLTEGRLGPQNVERDSVRPRDSVSKKGRTCDDACLDRQSQWPDVRLLHAAGQWADRWSPSLGAAEPVLQLQLAEQRPEIVFLSWDTEGGDKVERNLLRPDPGVTLNVRTGGRWTPAAAYPVRIEQVDSATTAVRMTVGKDAELSWDLTSTAIPSR